MIQEREGRTLPGYPMLFGLLAATAALVIVLIFDVVDVAQLGPVGELAIVAIVVALVLGYVGLTAVNPNEARALVLFGRYNGSLKQQGFWWVNPFTRRRRVSIKVRNFESQKLKVNDHDGNPIEIAAVVVWRVRDTAEALFEVDDYEEFLKVQTEAAIRTLTTSYPYDSHQASRRARSSTPGRGSSRVP
jgi:regulator of protease activity HflC (stomatin/prohibitin superfamily)